MSKLEYRKDEIMNIYAGYGDRVRFTGRNGWGHQQEEAKKYFEVGDILIVAYVEVSQSSSTVYFVGIPDKGFNTVMFEDANYANYYLVKYDDNWADEVDIDGHTVLRQEEFDKLNKALDKVGYLTFYVGTNEEIEYENDELVRPLEASLITPTQYRTLKLLNIDSVGFAKSYILTLFEKLDEIEREEDNE